ncbi:MAG TPA: SseB family protein [Streptosporangiaceae bacterium]|nr:SseB family protein [Streptosporangiaceae bacterium]
MTISTAPESKATDTRSGDGTTGLAAAPAAAVEHALAAAITDAGRIGDLLEVLRSARLWLPLPAGGAQAIKGTAVTLPIVSYRGSDFVPAYSSADLLQQFARPDGADPRPAAAQAPVPHVVVRAADLARLLPASIGIALNAGASESVPVYPPGVSYLAAGQDAGDLDRLSVAPLPVRPDALLAGIAAGLISIAAVREATAAWLSVQFAGEGLLVAVTLDDPADSAAQDLVVGAVERAAWEAAPEDAAFPIDVTFLGSGKRDHIDEALVAAGSQFYRRG